MICTVQIMTRTGEPHGFVCCSGLSVVIMKMIHRKFKKERKKKGDLSAFERGMAVDARWAALSYWGFKDNRKKSVSSVGENVLLLPEVRREWPDCLNLIARQKSFINNSLQPRNAESISEETC